MMKNVGLRMDKAEENLVISMARKAGIKNIYKPYINAKNKPDAYLVNIKCCFNSNWKIAGTRKIIFNG